MSEDEVLPSPGILEGLFNIVKPLLFWDKEDERSVGLLKYKGSIAFRPKTPFVETKHLSKEHLFPGRNQAKRILGKVQMPTAIDKIL